MKLVLSIRQPWAYLITSASKDVENRDWPTKVRGNVRVHAGKVMTKDDYEACVLFCSGLPDTALPNDFQFPPFDELRKQCGGIVGHMNIVDCVVESSSPWFCGPFGFVLDAGGTLPFRPCR